MDRYQAKFNAFFLSIISIGTPIICCLIYVLLYYNVYIDKEYKRLEFLTSYLLVINGKRSSLFREVCSLMKSAVCVGKM
jgi:hypothetical protein